MLAKPDRGGAWWRLEGNSHQDGFVSSFPVEFFDNCYYLERNNLTGSLSIILPVVFYFVSFLHPIGSELKATMSPTWRIVMGCDVSERWSRQKHSTTKMKTQADKEGHRKLEFPTRTPSSAISNPTAASQRSLMSAPKSPATRRPILYEQRLPHELSPRARPTARYSSVEPDWESPLLPTRSRESEQLPPTTVSALSEAC